MRSVVAKLHGSDHETISPCLSVHRKSVTHSDTQLADGHEKESMYKQCDENNTTCVRLSQTSGSAERSIFFGDTRLAVQTSGPRPWKGRARGVVFMRREALRVARQLLSDVPMLEARTRAMRLHSVA